MMHKRAQDQQEITTQPISLFCDTCPVNHFGFEVKFPCPPPPSFGAQGSCTGVRMSLQVDRRGCGAGWETNMELGAAGRPSAVYAASVASPSASGRRDLLEDATGPAPCLKDSWGQEEGESKGKEFAADGH